MVDLDGEEEVDEEPAGLLMNAGPPMIKDEGSLGANVARAVACRAAVQVRRRLIYLMESIACHCSRWKESLPKQRKEERRLVFVGS